MLGSLKIGLYSSACRLGLSYLTAIQSCIVCSSHNSTYLLPLPVSAPVRQQFPEVLVQMYSSLYLGSLGWNDTT
jgi:hypothetical protein